MICGGHLLLHRIGSFCHLRWAGCDAKMTDRASLTGAVFGYRQESAYSSEYTCLL